MRYWQGRGMEYLVTTIFIPCFFPPPSNTRMLQQICQKKHRKKAAPASLRAYGAKLSHPSFQSGGSRVYQKFIALNRNRKKSVHTYSSSLYMRNAFTKEEAVVFIECTWVQGAAAVLLYSLRLARYSTQENFPPTCLLASAWYITASIVRLKLYNIECLQIQKWKKRRRRLKFITLGSFEKVTSIRNNEGATQTLILIIIQDIFSLLNLLLSNRIKPNTKKVFF